MSVNVTYDFDVAVIGGGPAGLSGALTLSRACRSVVVFDHGQPRNAAAKIVNNYLCCEGLSPQCLRETARQQVQSYGVAFFNYEVQRILRACPDPEMTAFDVITTEGSYSVRAVLLATGTVDELPSIDGLHERYGSYVHHCPFCDGWEHRDKPLVALAQSSAGASKLAQTLLGWSHKVTACSDGDPFSQADRTLLKRLEIPCFSQKVLQLSGDEKSGHHVVFGDGSSIPFHGLFFSSGQGQRSKLPQMLGCDCNEEGLVTTANKQCTNVAGVYLAGDADGDVQFAIVAAAEGAIAATAIQETLSKQDRLRALEKTTISRLNHD